MLIKTIFIFNTTDMEGIKGRKQNIRSQPQSMLMDKEGRGCMFHAAPVPGEDRCAHCTSPLHTGHHQSCWTKLTSRITTSKMTRIFFFQIATFSYKAPEAFRIHFLVSNFCPKLGKIRLHECTETTRSLNFTSQNYRNMT